MANLDILVVDDHPIFMSGIRGVLSELGSSVAITEAADAEAGLASLDANPNVDFICVDIRLPGGDGIEFLNEVKRRRIPAPVVMLSAVDAPEVVQRALRAGASGYISKTAGRDELLEGFRTILASGRYVSPALHATVDRLRDGVETGKTGGIQLTKRQRQILDLVAGGASNRTIGESLGIAESTVKGHLATLFDLFDAANRTSCIAEARRLGLLD